MRRLLRRCMFAAALIGSPALAQEFPNRPVTLVVPFAAGSGIDATARTVSEELGKALKQPVVIDYKPGANGTIAAAAVARAAPDGHTIFMTTVSTHSANPHLFKSIPYDPLKDFVGVSRVGNLPFMLIVDREFPRGPSPSSSPTFRPIPASSATRAPTPSASWRGRRCGGSPPLISCMSPIGRRRRRSRT